MLSKQRFHIFRPLEEMEISLVRAAERDPQLVNPMEETVLRSALSLARLYKVRHEGKEVAVGAFLAPFREQVTRRLAPPLAGGSAPNRAQLMPLLPDLKDSLLSTRSALIRRFQNRLPESAIDHELRHKSLVLVLGGGGGTGYVYLGVMALLDELGIQPSLLVGTSIGAVLSLFRSRMARFEQTEVVNIVRGLSWRKLFRFISTESRYGLPAAMRLFLRAGIGRYFSASARSQGEGVRLSQLPIPTLVAVSGIRRGMLPHPVEFYERLFNPAAGPCRDPLTVARRLHEAIGALGELVTHPEIMVKLHLGLDPITRDFDAVDAAGFSSALPGVIHYDVLREDHRMRELLDALFESKGISRLIDGGLVDNLPAQAAWDAVHKGFIGTRNAFILALNGFSPRLSTPLWLPMQRLAELTVAPNRPYAHLSKEFRRTLSPLELVPSVELLARAVELGRTQMAEEAAFLARMLAPLPRLSA